MHVLAYGHLFHNLHVLLLPITEVCFTRRTIFVTYLTNYELAELLTEEFLPTRQEASNCRCIDSLAMNEFLKI